MTDLEQAKQKLISLRQQFSQRLNQVENDLHHVNEKVEQDFAEQATQRENDDVLNSLEHETKDIIRQIDSALLRIQDGSYGYCDLCGEAIDERRLEAVPYARRCIDCADEPY